ncbi:MAG: single-stranded DNA-binding protein [Firmicutes bacterium]|nr:single-stranded DNA-binding protein [Bacillota bacterium]
MNKCIFLGRLVRDPELKEAGEKKVASFVIAVDRKYKSKKEDAQTADFISINAWNKSAEFVRKYFKKGMPIIVCGSLETYSYETENGKRYGFRINSEELHFAGSKNESADSTQNSETDSLGSDSGFEIVSGDDDDDLPF